MTMIDPTRIHPYGDHILIRRDDFDEKTRGGIIIPDIAKTAAKGSRQQLRRGRGTVIAIGPGARRTKRVDLGYYESNGVRATREVELAERVPPDVQIGDRVCFSILLTLGDLDELGHPDLTLIREDDIEVVLEDAP